MMILGFKQLYKQQFSLQKIRYLQKENPSLSLHISDVTKRSRLEQSRIGVFFIHLDSLGAASGWCICLAMVKREQLFLF